MATKFKVGQAVILKTGDPAKGMNRDKPVGARVVSVPNYALFLDKANSEYQVKVAGGRVWWCNECELLPLVVPE